MAPAARKGPGWLGRRGYSDEFKAQARSLYLAGDTPAEIGAALDVDPRTVRTWAKKHGWHDQLSDRRGTAANIEAQLARLAERPPTESVTRRIAMLSRALGRVQKALPKPRPRPVVRIARHAETVARVMAPEFGLRDYQRDFLTDDARFRCVLKSRQIGFSWLLGLEALLGAQAGRDQNVVSASQDQSDIILGYVRRHAEALELPLDAGKGSEIQLAGATIRALPANPRTIQGYPGDVILDEFAWHQRPRKIWGSVVPSVTSMGGRVTVCSTPFVPGTLFWEIATNHGGRHGHFSQRVITIHDALAGGMEIPGGLDELRMLFDSETWAMAYLCQWAEDGQALLSWDLLHRAATAMQTVSTWPHPVWVGVDVGRVNDRLAICVVGEEAERLRLLAWEEHKGLPFRAQEALLRDTLLRWQVRRCHIDRTGLGAQLAEGLESDFPGIALGRWFTPRLKADLATNLLKLLEDEKLELPNDPALLAQLHRVKKLISAGGVKYEAPRTTHGHADTFWALALAAEHLALGEAGGGVQVEVW